MQIRHLQLKPTPVTYGSLFAALGCGHRWVQMVALLEDAPNLLQQAPIATNVALGVLRKAHRWDLALALCMQEGRSRIVSPVGLAELVAACSKGHAWQHGLALALANQETTVQTYNWLLYGFRTGASWQAGIALLAHASCTRIIANAISHRHLMCLLTGGPWQHAAALLQSLQDCPEWRISPDAETLVSALAACDQHHRSVEKADILAGLVSGKLQSYRSRGGAVCGSRSLHDVVMLHDTCANAGLPSVLEPLLGRHWISSLVVGLQQQQRSTHIGPLDDGVLQNAHVLPSFVARRATELGSLRGASRWTTTWWAQARSAVSPALKASSLIQKADATAVCVWIWYEFALPYGSLCDALTVEASRSNAFQKTQLSDGTRKSPLIACVD